MSRESSFPDLQTATFSLCSHLGKEKGRDGVWGKERDGEREKESGKEKGSSLVSLLKRTLMVSDEVSALTTSFKLITSLEASSPNIGTLGVLASTYKLGERHMNIHSTACAWKLIPLLLCHYYYSFIMSVSVFFPKIYLPTYFLLFAKFHYLLGIPKFHYLLCDVLFCSVLIFSCNASLSIFHQGPAFLISCLSEKYPYLSFNIEW